MSIPQISPKGALLALCAPSAENVLKAEDNSINVDCGRQMRIRLKQLHVVEWRNDADGRQKEYKCYMGGWTTLTYFICRGKGRPLIRRVSL